ncbi:MAG: IMPACT family protein [Bacteroidales bacterium]
MGEQITDSYLTIEKPTQAIFKDKGSKFIAYAYAVKTVEEINEKLALLKSEHHKARHHCYAWRLGADLKNFRANDDGEPSNSAGKPILGQIQSFELTDILIVVVRYFGGTLLGVSGLVNAYRTASKESLLVAKVINKEIHELINVEFEYPLLNDVMRIVKERNLDIAKTQYTSNCIVSLSVRLSEIESILQVLNSIYGVSASIKSLQRD